tara:strand:+ start:924 stop:3905 length:2982 start_codon:yes stop_codon:yes gene_type:complete
MAVIRQQTQVFNKPVGVRRINTGEAELWETIKAEADEFSKRAYLNAAEKAKKTGAQTALDVETMGITTIDPTTGKPQAFEAPEGYGKFAQEAYQNVITQRYESSISDEMQSRARDLSVKYEYDPEGYSQAMSKYIADMSENAEGMYKNIIVDEGRKRLGAEKHTIEVRTRARYRQEAGNSIIESATQSSERAFDAASVGNFELAFIELEKTETNAANGETSKLLNAGSISTLSNPVSINIGKGAIQYVMNKTGSSAERNRIELYLRTRGESKAGINKNLIPALDQILKVGNPETLPKILTYAAAVAQDFNQVDADTAYAKKLEDDETALRAADAAKEDSILNDLGYSDRREVLSDSALKAVNQIFDESISLSTAAGSISFIAKQTEEYIIDARNRAVMDDSYSPDEALKFETDLRQDVLTQIVTRLAVEGNGESLESALAGTKTAYDRLNDKQKLIVQQLRGNKNLYKSSEDGALVSAIVNRSKDSIANDIKKQKLLYDIAINTDSKVNAYKDIPPTNEELTKDLDFLQSAIAKGVSAEKVIVSQNRLYHGAATGMISEFSIEANSAEVNDLEMFILTKGEDVGNLNNDQIEMAGTISTYLKSDKARSDAVVHSGKLKTKIITRETAEAKENAKVIKRNKVLNGGGSPNEKSDRVVMDGIIIEAGLGDLENFDTWSNNKKKLAMSYLTNIPPQSLISAWDKIGSGVPVNNMGSFVKHFMRLDNLQTPDGLISRLGNSVPLATKEFIRDVHSIATVEGGDYDEIAINLYRRTKGADVKESNIAITTALGKQSIEEFTSEIVDKDLILIEEFMPSVEYLLRMGNTKEQVRERLSNTFDKEYPEVEFIADPLMPLGNLKRSRYALSNSFPNEEVRNEFISIVQTQLPDGYSLYEEDGKQQIYLVPEKTSSTPAYIAYYADEQKELKPLLVGKEGQEIVPMWKEKEITEFRARMFTRLKQQAEENADKEAVYEGYKNEARKHRSGSDALRQFFGGNS